MPLLILFVFVDLLDLTSMDMVIWYWQPRVVLQLFSKVLFGGKCLLAKGKFVPLTKCNFSNCNILVTRKTREIGQKKIWLNFTTKDWGFLTKMDYCFLQS